MMMRAERAPLFRRGARVGDTYTIDTYVGAGAYGEVYRIQHRYLGTQAMKVFPSDTLDATQDFFEEARVLVELTHPNVVRVFDANVVETQHGQLAYLTMEYVNGETLGTHLRRRVRLPLAEANALAVGLSSGLAAAHSLDPPLLHLDLTIENVIVGSKHGRLAPKIADFGIAGHVHPVTRLARARGTYFFMAPEMFWGYATSASDVYCLAFLLYWVYAGVPPYPYPTLPDGATRDDWIAAVRRSRLTPPPPLARFRLDVPREIAKILEQSLAPDAGDRLPSAQALAAAFTPLGS
jgi:serine/threonine-protein kinase